MREGHALMPLFDSKDKSRYATFSRRALLLSGGMTAVFGVLAGRLYQLQIVDGDLYLTRAENNRVNQRLLAPPRGRIFDRFGVQLASNRRNYRALIVPEQAPEGLEKSLAMLAQVIPLSERQRARVLKDAQANKSFVPLVVAENLDWNDFARLNLDLPYLPGVQPDVGQTRDYPFGEEFSHVLGYVAAVSPEDKIAAEKEGKKAEDPLLGVPGFRIGKRGIEKELDPAIRGKAGASSVEVNAYGRVIRELARDPGAQGDDVYLTIDRELQAFTHERLKNESAACVVMDAQNGDMLAMVSTPGFDPNAFNVGLTSDQWTALTTNDHKPLLNKVMSGVYPPGSTFKIVTALAALEAGVIAPDFATVCTGATSLGNHRFHCWKRGGHGRVDLHLGMKYSCDVYFYEVARKLGIDALAEGALNLGFGTPTGLQIPGERSGFVPNRSWKQARFNEAWQQGETLIAGIGQGFLQVTPVQLCQLAARVASGMHVSPRLIHSTGERTEPRRAMKRLNVSDEALEVVRAGLNGVMNEPGGTAYGSRIHQAGFEMAGKTGTAQVRRISAEERRTGVRSNQSLPWHLRDHALFIAYAPVVNPRYACSVIIDHGMSGSGAAAPVARDVLTFAQNRDLLNKPVAYPVTASAISAPRRS